MKKRTLIPIVMILILSTGFVFGLFFYTDYKNHLPGSFIRLFPPHVISGTQKELKLPVDQYQIAGLTKNYIYLNQNENPLILLRISYGFEIRDSIILKLPDKVELNLKRVRITVNDQGVFITDGTQPIVLSGNTTNWKLRTTDLRNNFFNEATFIDTSNMAIIKLIPKKGRILGILNTDSYTSKLNPEALEKQVDGFFSTDGTMHYNPQLQKLIYTYYYRNEYVVLDKNLKVEARYNTIDTTTRAKIKIREVMSKGQRSMATPPPVVNRRSRSQNHWLFNQSKIRAKNESEKQFKQGQVIDVYNLKKGTYKHSFYIPNLEGQALRDFRIDQNHLLVLYPDRIVRYALGKNYLGPLKATKGDNVIR